MAGRARWILVTSLVACTGDDGEAEPTTTGVATLPGTSADGTTAGDDATSQGTGHGETGSSTASADSATGVDDGPPIFDVGTVPDVPMVDV